MTFNYRLNSGAANNKLVLGVPTFARTWKITKDSKLPPFIVDGPGKAGPITRISGVLSHSEVCELIYNNHTDFAIVSDPTKRFGEYFTQNRNALLYFFFLRKLCFSTNASNGRKRNLDWLRRSKYNSK